ncbi:synaptopodin-2 [Neosynchiropus ocellatus]
MGCDDFKEFPRDQRPLHSANRLGSPDRESEDDQGSSRGKSEEEDDVLYKEESACTRGSPPSSPDRESHDSDSPAGQETQPHSQSSSSFFGAASDSTPALTLTTPRLGAASSNRSSGSSEEGGSSEAPPAPVFFGIPGGGAEHAEKRNSESDTDLYRRDRERARCTRFNTSQSEKNVKETKSKCKRIARLLTNAPNPQNKGALLFEKRRQRVKKYTLVSYGTGENRFDCEDQIQEEAEEVRAAAYSFVTSDSELEEEYSLYQQTCHRSRSWESVRRMDALPETKGKGVLMFDRRRKRLDALDSEQEEPRSRTLPAEPLRQHDCPPQDIYDSEEMFVHSNQSNYSDAQQSTPKSLVPNRTAKPFLGFQVRAPVPFMPAHVAPVTKRPEPRFKIRVPISTSPQVWSPTGDIIASRDERISVPAIKTGILPESKRKATNKQAVKQETDPKLQNKGDRRSYIEPEEDCFSLGAEACNFMQPRTVKLKNPPPVAPKPTFNPSCPPWMKSPNDEPFIPPRSPGSLPPYCQMGTHYSEQQDLAQLMKTSKSWAPDQDQAPATGWERVNSSSQPHLEPSTNSWSQQPSRSPVSMNPPSSTAMDRSESAPNSVASCPPQAMKSFSQAPEATSLRGQSSVVDGSRASSGPSLTGKGAQLFAKRQFRMEKFVVTGDKAHTKPRSPSPTSSLPHSWRYSSNVRAPPPLSYNPLLAPFYPPSAAKQASSSSPKSKPREKPPKQLNALDIMKHQPYQLDSALFKYDAMTKAVNASPKPPPKSKFQVTKSIKQRFTDSPNTGSENKSKKSAQSSKWVFGRSHPCSLTRRMNSVPCPMSPPGSQRSLPPPRRQTSYQEAYVKPPTPWEAASRSPLGSVDEAFLFQSLPSSVASNVKALGLRRSLPEPPEEWKRRVSLDPAPVAKGHYRVAPTFLPAASGRTRSPEKPAFYGPPFRPAQPLRSASRSSYAFTTQGSHCTPLHTAFQRS